MPDEEVTEKEKKKKRLPRDPDAEVDDPLVLSKMLIKALNKDGAEKAAWCLATDSDNPTDVKDFISTGNLLLDYIIRNAPDGGVPVGKITEFVGEEATGKSLLIVHVLAETQRRGGLAVLIDEENALNPEFAARVGLDLKKLVYLQCGTVEAVGEAIEKVITLARSKDVKRFITVAWDSVAGTPTRMELEGTLDVNMNSQLEKSKVLAIMMRKLTRTVGVDRITMVFTNQMKTKIGVMFGDPMGTPGGKAIPYHASVRVRLKRAGELKDPRSGSDDVVGIHTRAKVIKNRLGPPLRVCEFDIHFSNGVDNVSSWLPYLHSVGEIEKDDGWLYIPSLPSGKVETKKGAHEGKDRGVKFQTPSWEKILERPEVKAHVLKLLEKHLVVKYDTPAQQTGIELDPESLTDAEAVADIVQQTTGGV
jgi:recombination protein RecA